MSKDYIKASEVNLLRDAGFSVGFSGESWFATDPSARHYWHAYPSTDNELMVFVNSSDRASQYLTRQKFEEIFSGQRRSGK